MRRAIEGAVLLCAAALGGCGERKPAVEQAPVAASPQALQDHSREFRREVVKAAEGVHVAIGYGIANSILLEGPDGLVIVDTMETVESAREVLAAFRRISDKPVRAIIYTHSHPDHIGGARVFAEGNDIPVYAHADVVRHMEKTSVELQPVITRRSLRMYGPHLTPEERVNVGIGGHLAVEPDSTLDILRPTQVFQTRQTVTVAGLTLELVHAPGETEDQLFVWLPDRRILLPGDNFYRAFPNLYTLRGTGYRDPRAWADSIDRMRALKPAVLVPSHTRPVQGEAEIAAALTDYRDAIRFVHDQTLRWMNLGLGPEEIAARLRLPAHLAKSPWLPEFYGRPGWSARSVFAGNLGWFDGDPANIQPLPPKARAEHYARLAGGPEGLRQQVLEASTRGEHQWVLELSGHALRLAPDDAELRAARVRALRALGEAESNPNARHWYLMTARELAGELTLPSRALTPTPAMLAQMPLQRFFDGMAVNLDAEAAADTVISVGFVFTDSPERYTYLVRRGVSELVPALNADADLVVRLPAQVFKEMLAQLRNPAAVIARDIEMERGNRLDFVRFMRLFQPEESGG